MSAKARYLEPVAPALTGENSFGNLRQVLQGPVLVAIAYYVGAEIAFFIGTLSDKIFAPFWPPNVVLFCALLLAPYCRWWLYIAAVIPAHVVAELGVGMPAGQLLVAFATNGTVAVLNALALRHLVRHPPWFGDLRKAAIYVAITAGLSPAAVAIGGAFVPILGGGPLDNYWLYWTYWYVANALSSLALGSVFLAWSSESPKSSAVTSGRAVEAAALGLLLVIVCTLAFDAGVTVVGSGFLPAILYTPVPFVLWATVRFGAKGASTAILTVTVVLIWRTLKGPSVFIGPDPETNVLALQLFLTGLSVPLLLFGAAIDNLRHAEQTMRSLAGSVLTAQDEERRRIARELHDSTGQNLIAASMLLSRIQQTPAASAEAVCKEVEDILQQSVSELRTMSYLLHPALLDEAGLPSALKHLADGIHARSGLVVDVAIYADYQRLRPEVELALFRVAQEALTNVTRHSGSKSARIRLKRGRARGRQSTILTVEDVGRGMASRSISVSLPSSPRKASSGIGLVSMQERLHQIGGWLEVESRVGKTLISAIVPRHNEAT